MMEAVFLTLVNLSISAGWIVLAVLVLRLVLTRGPKWINCLLWGIMGLRLVVPVSIESTLSLLPSGQVFPAEFIYTAYPYIQSGIPVIDDTVNPILSATMVPEMGASVNPTQLWSFILTRVWVVGMLIMLIYALASYLLLKHRVATATILQEGIKQSEYVTSPFVLGLFRPTIYLPYSMDETDMKFVVAHEKAHMRRGDQWWKIIGFVLLAVYWFHPLVWVAYIFFCRDIEKACDERVVRGSSEDERRAYSTALLKCSVRRFGIAACPLAFGEVSVKERVKRVMNYKKPAFWMVILGICSCVIVTVCLLTYQNHSERRNKEIGIEVSVIAASSEYVRYTLNYMKQDEKERMSHGGYYGIQKKTLMGWENCETILDDGWSVTVDSITINEGESLHICNWTYEFGELKNGIYRLIQPVTICDRNDNRTDACYYVTFVVDE